MSAAMASLQVISAGTSETLVRPCVDCGKKTGRFCDYCRAADRIPNENWADRQMTPLCSDCDNKHDRCHFCREDEQKRVAWDGQAYTAKEFSDHYGSRGSEFWKVAETLLDHSNSATTSQQSQSVTSTTLGLHHPQGETTSPDASTEHNLGPRVLLSVADIQGYKKEEAAKYRPPRPLHKMARNALLQITLEHVDGDVARDLNDWFDWRSYIACHKDAERIIGAGVTRAVAESIPNSRDANQGYQERVNFVFTRADGTLCLVHPGSKPRQDAALIFC